MEHDPVHLALLALGFIYPDYIRRAYAASCDLLWSLNKVHTENSEVQLKALEKAFLSYLIFFEVHL